MDEEGGIDRNEPTCRVPQCMCLFMCEYSSECLPACLPACLLTVDLLFLLGWGDSMYRSNTLWSP